MSAPEPRCLAQLGVVPGWHARHVARTQAVYYPAGEPPPAFPITSQLEGEMRELRVRFANTRYRILHQRSENLVVLLHALEKDTGAVPRSDIELAKQRMADFKRRMNAPRRTPARAAGKDAPPRNRPVAHTYQDG